MGGAKMGTNVGFRRPDGKEASGYLAKAGRAKAPGVVVIQEWWGLQEQIKGICDSVGIPYIFKASFDKANRSSLASYRGPGYPQGLQILENIKITLDIPILSDIHETVQVERAAQVLDILQIPAFLCRQTDLLVEAARTGKPINIKKGPFIAPHDMKNIVDKIQSQGNTSIIMTERGTSFGYNNLVFDVRSIPIMKSLGYPVVIDASHSVQKPGGKKIRNTALTHKLRMIWFSFCFSFVIIHCHFM